MKVLITGGHHNSALVIANALKNLKYLLVWVGHRYTMLGDKHDSLEYQEVTQAGIPYINSLAGKFHAKAHALHLLKIPLGFIQAITILKNQKPNLILSFGSYISVPICFAAKLFNIPIIVFEQTTAIGRANQLVSRLAHMNFLTWDSSLQYFPSHKSTVIGLPLPKDFFKKPTKKLFIKSRKKTILITGGKQGSHVINQVIFEIIEKLLKKYNVIHQTGKSLKTQDYQTALKIKKHLKSKLATSYIVTDHFTSQAMHDAIKQADIIISRSGAHIAYELLSLGKPSILIPLPFSYHQEQLKNAKKLSSLNLASILPQKNLTSKNLLEQVNLISKKLKLYKRIGKTASKTIPQQAEKQVIKYIQKNFPNDKKAS